MRAVALLLALLVGAQCAVGQGFIHTSGQKFVDDNCKEFVPVGMNAYVLWHAHYQLCCTCFGVMATESRYKCIVTTLVYVWLARSCRFVVGSDVRGCCRWMLLETVVGTSNNLPNNPLGLNQVDFTMQAAVNNSQTTVRMFGHGVNSTMALQPEQGDACCNQLCCSAALCSVHGFRYEVLPKLRWSSMFVIDASPAERIANLAPNFRCIQRVSFPRFGLCD